MLSPMLTKIVSFFISMACFKAFLNIEILEKNLENDFSFIEMYGFALCWLKTSLR